MLPFTREIPARQWLGFVHESDSQGQSALMTRVLPGIAALGAVLLVVSGGKQTHEPEGPPPSSAAAMASRTASVAPSTPEPAPEPAPAPEPEPEPAPEPAAVEPTTADAPATDTPTDPPAAATPEPAPEPVKKPRVVKPPKPLSPAAARRASRAATDLRGAVASGSVKRSRENFATTTSDGDEQGWTEAKAACASLSIDGVGGWKLPTRSEAREIHRGSAAPNGAYWTRQRGAHDDTIYVYDPRTRRSSPWLDQEIARVVCVQPRPR